MSDATVRVARGSGFTVVQNNAIRDPRLSLSAVGLYVRMMSLPEGKPHSLRYITKVAGCGRDALRRCFGELEDAGYMVREQQHVEHGKFGANAYALYDTPISPSTGFPATVNPTTAEPSTAEPTTAEPTTAEPSPENPTTKEITIESNIPPVSPKGDESAELFDRFWALYPRKQGKAAAQKAWNRLKPDLPLCHRMSAALKAQLHGDEWLRDGGRYIPYPATWLNGRRWEDERVAFATGYGPLPSAPEREEDQCLT